jgi:hypothetical protein
LTEDFASVTCGSPRDKSSRVLTWKSPFTHTKDALERGWGKVRVFGHPRSGFLKTEDSEKDMCLLGTSAVREGER